MKVMFTSVCLVGNPNVGKSVLFWFLTGHYVSVSNYPGTTVEVTHGMTSVKGVPVAVIDTPGINTLIPMSEDEEVTRNILFDEGTQAVIQVADAKNLSRALLISLQLAETGLPFELALNMKDELPSRGIRIDEQKLSKILGVSVVGTVAIEKQGLGELKENIGSLKAASYTFVYSDVIEMAIKALEPLLPATHISRRSVALLLLAGDIGLKNSLQQKIPAHQIGMIDAISADLASGYSLPMATVIEMQRLQEVERIVQTVVDRVPANGRGWKEWFGRISIHPVGGIGVLAGVLAALYGFVGKFGAQTAVGWLEHGLFGRFINPWSIKIFGTVFFFSSFIQDLFVGPYGVITMALTYALAIVLPIVLTFFIFFSVMEDSGYLPRLAVMLNRIFRMMGLNGKAVVPMVLGLGCDTMATLSARIMDTKKERVILTLLLALGVPCSAQLGIIFAMLAALPAWASVLWFVVVGGVLLGVGYLASRVLPGDRSDFLVELPPIRTPALLNILTKTIARLEWYLKEVIPLFVIGTLVLFFLDRFHLLLKIQNLATPLVVGWLHLPPEASEAFLIGFLRRDYAATHFFDMFGKGQLDAIQATVALIVVTLFVPCLANVLMIVKERGLKTASAIVGFIYPFSFAVGGVVSALLRWGIL